MKKQPKIHVIADECRGIYCPKFVAENYEIQGVSEEDLEILRDGPENPDYWETWDETLQKGFLIGESGTEYSLCQDGTVFAVEKGWWFDGDAEEWVKG